MRGSRPPIRSVKASQFEVVPAGDLYTVVDMTTGHEVIEPTYRVLADLEADILNSHAAGGGRWLAAILADEADDLASEFA
jgi:hypothetical protein